MPELPEVETVRAQLEPGSSGAASSDVEILDPRLTRPTIPPGSPPSSRESGSRRSSAAASI